MSSSERQPGNGAVIAKELWGEFTWASGDRVASVFAVRAAVCAFVIPSVQAVAILFVVENTMVKLWMLRWTYM